MKFQRIDEETICCILTAEDMQEYGLEMTDFLTDKEKVHKFLENIVEQAREEVGYESKSGMLAMQIAVMPDNGIAITFSEKADDNIKNVIEQILGGNRVLEDLTGRVQQEDLKKERSKKNKELYIYRFDTFEMMEKFCGYISFGKPIKSRLYKDVEHDQYYLMLRKGKLSKKEYETMEQIASEFGTFVSDEPVRAEYMEEHYQCMIKKKAVNVIQSI